ncbi:C40 family peptidase [Streptomyces hesseae]|uniref:C40 family peptidase n=1 Tax=Streptomyces hesseae TaxID=3075519 RepID=A0ABU2SQL7_9ACTN|nr:C40 family peptidase [Streptomyces sp. DSM 40473]MDT0450931.1 C40 family peptidase [Streptomyces sp. DSM 40473]
MSGRFVRVVSVVRVVRASALAVSTATAVLALTAAPAPKAFAAPADPPGQPVSALLTRLRALYRQAEEATEAYDATDDKLKKQRARTDRLNEELVDARIALTTGREEAGRIAREQYRGSRGLSPYVQFLLSDDPRQAMARGHEMRRAAGRRADAVERLTDGERRAAVLAREAREALNAQQTLAAEQKRQRDAIQERLGEVERLLASLDGEQLAALRRAEADGVGDAQRRLLASGALSGAQAPSEEGVRALDFAFRQVGKPYVWGAEGPDAFDCSGLTSQAWAHAGDVIPRTSQEQWKTLPKVPLNQLRPGDLVLYFEGATHVALYLGHGQVIQAPRPGDVVKISPIAANPLLGAVRPDAGKPPMTGYVPPAVSALVSAI